MQNPSRTTRLRYQERLTPSLWVLVALAVVGPMMTLSFLPIGATLGLVLGALAVIGTGALAIFGSPVVSVSDNTLRAGRAHIDARFLSDPLALTGDDARHARGPGLSARGWHLFRPGIDGVVVVTLTDPDDTITSWTIASRTPERLAAAIASAVSDTADTKTRPA